MVADRGPTVEAEPAKYWLSTLRADIVLVELLHLVKYSWIHRTGLSGTEAVTQIGSLRGTRLARIHHATLCIASYGFLVEERSRFPSTRIGLVVALIGILCTPLFAFLRPAYKCLWVCVLLPDCRQRHSDSGWRSLLAVQSRRPAGAL